MLGEPQRDLTPEAAASRLRAVEHKHYLDNKEGGDGKEFMPRTNFITSAIS
jgi:hypothetical protein